MPISELISFLVYRVYGCVYVR